MSSDKEAYLLQRELNDHVVLFDKHVELQNRRWDQLMRSQEETNGSIKKLVACTTELHSSTKDIVEAWNTGTSVVKFGGMIGRFIKWLAGFAILGSIINWLSNHVNL